MISFLNIIFLAGGTLILSGALDRALKGKCPPGRRTLLAFAVFPALLLGSALLASAACPPSSRFLASPVNAATVAASYALMALAVILLLRRNDGESLRPAPAERPRSGAWKASLPFILSGAAVLIKTGGWFGEGNGLIFSGLLAAAALASLPLLDRGGEARAFLLACLPYLAFGAAYAVSPETLEGDSMWFHEPVFKFIARSFAAGEFLPPWLPQSGGIRIGFFHINFFFSLPHRAAGYFLYSLFPIPPAVLYKIQYLLGTVTFSLGWWMVLRKITGNRTGAFLGVLMISLGGTGITFHQEQAVATAYLLPWFVLLLLDSGRRPFCLLAAGTVFGLGLTLHYPQIQSISLALAAAGLAAAGLIRPGALVGSGKRYLLSALLLALLAAGPAVYLWRESPRLASGLRKMDIGERPRNLPEYLNLQRGASSAAPAYLLQYWQPRWSAVNGERPPIDVSDRCAFFVGRPGLILAVVGLILGLPAAGLVGILAAVFALLSIGINSPLPFPRYFYQLGIPFFDVFRQWVHFFPMINYCLSLLAAIGISRILGMSGRRPRRVVTILVAGTVFFQVFDTALYGRRYLSLFPSREQPAGLQEMFFERDNFSASSVFQYRDRYHLNRLCGERAIPPRPYLTPVFRRLDPRQAGEPEQVCRYLSLHPDIPAVTPIGPGGGPSGEAAPPGQGIQDLEFAVGFTGIAGQCSAAGPGLVVTPLNRGLEARAFLNGKPAPAYPVNCALTGIPVGAGDLRLELRVAHDCYLLFFLVQWLLFLFVAAAVTGSRRPRV